MLATAWNVIADVLRRLVRFQLASMGFRTDRHRGWHGLGHGLGLCLSFAVGQWIALRNDPALSVSYCTLAILVCYGGNGAILGTELRRRWIERSGVEVAWRRYEMLMGHLFLHQGLGVGAVAAWRPSSLGGLELPSLDWPAHALGAVLFFIGFSTKWWATELVGLDVYYYRDLFERRATGVLVHTGPYRWLTNPMYGVGHVHSYGYALLRGSWPALIAAAACQAAVYCLYFLVERPFVRQTYGAALPGPPFSARTMK